MVNLPITGSHEIGPNATNARRVVVVLSPESLSNNWTEANVSQILRQLSGLGLRIVIVSLKDLPILPTKQNCRLPNGGIVQHQGTTTTAVDRRGNKDNYGLEILRWRDDDRVYFWHRLRFALPPIRHNINKTTTANNDTSSVVVNEINHQDRSSMTTIVLQDESACGGDLTMARSRESLEVLV